MKTFGLSRIRGRHRFNPSGILVTYTTSFKSKYTSSKAEHGWPSRWYNLPKALCIRGRTHKVIEYEVHCRITIQQWSGDPQRSWCEYRYSLWGRKNAEASNSRITWLVWCLNRNKSWFPKWRIRIRCSDQGWISWKHLVGQSMTIWLVDNQVMFKMTSEPEG